MEDVKFTNEQGENINVSLLGFFTIPDLEKEYIMYGITDDNDSNDDGYGKVLLGEVKRTENNIQILGILPTEIDLVVAYYNEISNQIGGEE